MVELAIATPSEHDHKSALAAAVQNQVASRLAARDSTLWGPQAQPEAAKRLAWTHLHETSRPLIAQIQDMRNELAQNGLDHVVLCGMGGSSLAPEVICKAAGVELTVLDSSQPDMVRAAIADRLERSIVVVSSKSGGTVETDSQRRAYEFAFTAAGLSPADHIVVVTDPDSPLDVEATKAGYRVFRADPEVGGRYSALTAFGLVPSGLAGAPIGRLLDEAAAVAEQQSIDSADNPALQIAILLAQANEHRVDKLVIVDQQRHGVGDWLEQLVAESTGKEGKGILPVVVPFEIAVNFNPSTPDSVLVALGTTTVPESQSGYAMGINGSLGEMLLLWESVIALTGHEIGINPFDQPDVESAKAASRELLDGGAPAPRPDFSEDGIDVFGTSARTLTETVRALLAAVDLDHGYLSVQAYLDRYSYADLAGVRETLAHRIQRPVTFGWAPRFLHSTGQYHKGGPATGVYLQITCDPDEDLDVPGRDFTFGQFIASQSTGDAHVLRAKGRPVVRLHLHELETGLTRLRGLLS